MTKTVENGFLARSRYLEDRTARIDAITGVRAPIVGCAVEHALVREKIGDRVPAVAIAVGAKTVHQLFFSCGAHCVDRAGAVSASGCGGSVKLPVEGDQFRFGVCAVFRDAGEAVDLVRRGEADVTFLTNPVSMEQLREVAFAGDVMPQKSTDFFPKLLSGLAIYALD